MQPLDLKTVPARIVGRTDLLQDLAAALMPMLKGTPVDVELVGPTGTGKTTCISALLRALPEAIARPVSFDHVIIDCNASQRASGIVIAILQAFSPAYPAKGFSLELMLEDVARLVKARGRPLVVVLDDHHLLRKGEEILQALSDLRTRHQVPLSLVVVREVPMDTLAFPRILVRPYTAVQARAIVAAHAEQTGLRLSPKAVETLAGATRRGGIKRAMLALQACQESGETTQAGARTAVATCDGRFNQRRLDAYSDHHLFILRALCGSPGPMRSRRLRDAYWQEAQLRHEKPLANVQFLKYVAQLARAGFLEVKPLRGGEPGGALAVTLLALDRTVALAEVDAALMHRNA